MLSLPNDGRYPALDLTPEQRRQKTLNALTAQMEALARQKSLLMIFEDVHWTDPTSLEALGRTVDRIKSLRVLLIVAYRPEFEPFLGWKPCGIRRRRNARACGAVPGACREATGNASPRSWAPPYGQFAAAYGRFRGRPSSLQSVDRAL
jgi:hypothetical protein